MVIETITIVVNVVNEQYSVFVVGNLNSSKHGQLEGYGVRVLQGPQTGKYIHMIVYVRRAFATCIPEHV